MVYVGSAKSQEYDQELDSVMVGPVPLGTSRFVLEVGGMGSRWATQGRTRAEPPAVGQGAPQAGAPGGEEPG